MIITVEDIDYLKGQQELLDSEIRKSKGIDDKTWEDMTFEHMTALAVEVGEFVNETKVFKYWSEKPVNENNLLDEAVDVIHFVMLMANKLGLPSERLEINEGDFVELDEDFQAKGVAYQLLGGVLSEPLSNTFFRVLLLVDYLGYTWEEVLDQYDLKNRINFERLENGY